jgi:hypothetical protein
MDMRQPSAHELYLRIQLVVTIRLKPEAIVQALLATRLAGHLPVAVALPTDLQE